MIFSVAQLQNSGYIADLSQGGIFILRCIPTEDIVYLGATTRSFRQRWKEIRKQARNPSNRRISPQIRSLWQAYGDAGFEFEILEFTAQPEFRIEHYHRQLQHVLKINNK